MYDRQEFNHKEQWNFVFCRNIVESKRHHMKRNLQATENQILNDVFMESAAALRAKRLDCSYKGMEGGGEVIRHVFPQDRSSSRCSTAQWDGMMVAHNNVLLF